VNFLLIRGYKVRIIRPKIHSRVCVINGETKRLRQLSESADIVRILQLDYALDTRFVICYYSIHG